MYNSEVVDKECSFKVIFTNHNPFCLFFNLWKCQPFPNFAHPVQTERADYSFQTHKGKQEDVECQRDMCLFAFWINNREQVVCKHIALRGFLICMDAVEPFIKEWQATEHINCQKYQKQPTTTEWIATSCRGYTSS